MSISRHLILPYDKPTDSSSKALSPKGNKFEKLETDIKSFYERNTGANNDEEPSLSNQSESTTESACVLLHGALKIESMAALVLLSDNWYGFIYSCADSKRKSNLMLTILPPGKLTLNWCIYFKLMHLLAFDR